jgi:hypothetical protein
MSRTETGEDITVTAKKKELMFAPRVAGLFVFLLTAGCVGMESAPPPQPPEIGATLGGAVAGEAAVPPATPSTPPPPAGRIAKTTSPNATIASKGPAAPAPAAQLKKKDNAAPGPGKPEAPPALNLASLEQRLRDTKAIGVFTKISLKNQVDDLMTQFRAYHEGQAGGTLTALREHYNLLLLKVLSLLQDGDPPLAQAITASREPIWSLLADPVKFATL